MIKLVFVMSVAAIVASVSIFVAPVARATECAGVNTYFDWECGEHGGGDGFSQILLTIYNWMAAGVSVGVVIGILFGAVLYASAGGDEAKTKTAIATIRNSVTALILFFLMWSFLNFVTPGGLFAG